MEGVLLLATIAQKWRFAWKEEVAPLPLITLPPRGAMKMRAELL